MSHRRTRPTAAPVRSRALPRRLALSAAVTLAFLNPLPAWAADFVVSNNNDAGAGSLRQAIVDSNAAGGTNNIIINSGVGTITLTSGDLQTIANNATIVGNNNTLSGGNTFRGLFVGGFSGTTQTTVSVSVSGLTITNARAQGGSGPLGGGGGAGLGGAIFVANNATLTVSNVTLTGNSAVGGNGATTGASGGGGGMGGNGGTTRGGGGGLGVGSTGGNNLNPGLAGVATGASPGGTGGTGDGSGTAGGANGGGGGGSSTGIGGGSSAGGGVGGANGVNGGGVGGAGGFGGGGGAGAAATGGAGGFGGGGGGGGPGGAGGFGGGGGGSGGTGGTGGFGGGNGGGAGVGGGGGGAGLGGAVFVQQGGTLNVAGGFTVNGGTVTAGAAAGGGGGSTPGSAFGSGIFIQGNNSITFTPSSGQTQTIGDLIADQTGSGGTGGNAGAGQVVMAGAGTVVLSGSNTYVGGATINAGTLNVSADNNLGGAAGGLSFGGGTLQFGAGFSSARAVTLNAGGGTVDNNGNNVTLSGVISGTGGLSATGAGILTLTGANTYSGGTAVNAGTLRAGAANTFSATSAMTVAAGATMDLAGFNQTIASLAGGGNVTLGAATLTAGGNGISTTFSGVISGTGGLAHAGTGTLTLTGANSYTGVTTVNASGALEIGAGGTTGSITGNVTNVGLLVFNRSDSTTYAGVISGTGTVTQAGTGTLILTGANTYTGVTTVNAGTLQIGAGGTAGSIAGNVTNVGTLVFNRSDSTTYAGVILGAGTVTQAGTGTLILTGTNNYSGGTTINAGTLQIGAGGTTGSIDGNVTNNGTLAFNRSDNLAFFGGVVSGTGALTQAGTGTLILSGANTYTGGTTVNAGTLQIGAGGTTGSIAGNVTNNTALVFNRSDAMTFGGIVSGTGTLTQAGAGTLNLTGANTYSGATTVNAGTLAVNGSIASPVTVNSGGTLMGTGSIGGASIASGGVFAPGNSIGTMTVNGSVSFAPGSIYRVEADPAGNADRTNATGAATIGGGTVEVLAGAGTYQPSTQYTILNAVGGVTGTFSAVTSNLAFLAPSLSYGGNGVLLTLTRNATNFGQVGVTGNQIAVGSYLDTLSSQPALQPLITSITSLSAAQAQSAFSSMSGEGLTAPTRVATINTTNWMDMLSARIGGGVGKLAFAPIQVAQVGPTSIGEPKPGENRGVWLRARHLRGDQEAKDDANGYDFEGVGMAGGFDTAVGADSKLGVAYSYTRNSTTSHGGAGDAITRSPQLALYGLRAMDPWQFKGVLGLGSHNIQNNRNVIIGTSTGVAASDHRASEYSAYAEANYTFKRRGYETKTVMGLRYIYLDEDGYTEEGSAAPLTVDARTTKSITPLVGLRWLWPFNVERGRFELRAIYSYEAGDADAAVSGRLAAAPTGGTFTAHGAAISRHAVALGIGIENEVATRLSLYGDYSLDLREGSTVHALVLGARYAF